MSTIKTISVNRQALYNYHILERYEAGLELTGTEIKSIRAGKVDLRGSHARMTNNELWLHGMHISIYDPAASQNHDPKRTRRLLLNRVEIEKISSTVSQKGLTLVPLKVFVNRHWAKIELALAKGKRKYDKRRAIIDRDRDREAQRAIRRAI